MAYSAVVTKAHTRPHPNADKLQLATVQGYQVVVGLDVADGELGVFFPCDGQLSEEMCAANDLIGYTDENTGERKGGFFANNRRVRAQRFRGEKSDGYWTPLSSLSWTGIDVSSLNEGDQFTELNSVPVCNKYFTAATLKAMKNQAKSSQKRENVCFPKHVDTAQLKHEVTQIPGNTIVYVTEKLHGTSGRFGYVYEPKTEPRKWYQKLFRRPERQIHAYNHLTGTRNVVMADHGHNGFYGNEEFRYNAVEGLYNNLFKGEVIYFELVGYTTTGSLIMSEHSTDDLKEIKKQYGPKMVYKYGQPEGTCGLWVYRITRTNEDGQVVELPWNQVKARCRTLGLNHVPELAFMIHDGYAETLMALADDLMDGSSTLDESHIREGVVFRCELPDGETRFFKSKSFPFGVMEGYLKNNDEYVDTEEAA